MKRFVANVSLLAFLLLLLTSTPASAQATAELNGRVTDESGAVPPGPYRLEVSLQGFRTYVQTGIVLQVAAAPTIGVVLAVGNLEEHRLPQRAGRPDVLW